MERDGNGERKRNRDWKQRTINMTGDERRSYLPAEKKSKKKMQDGNRNLITPQKRQN